MKKILCLILALTMIMSFAACGEKTPASTPANAGEGEGEVVTYGDYSWNTANIGEHTFILAHSHAETSLSGQQYHEFALAVEELSGGKMIVEERIAGTLVADADSMNAIMNGEIDFCHSMSSYASGTIADLAPLTVPGYYGGEDWLAFANGTYDIISSIYADYGIKYVRPVCQGVSGLVCTERTIAVPSDATGLTLRASGTWISKAVDAWGGAAVTMSLPDLADGLSKGTVSGTITAMSVIIPFKLYEVAPYVTYTSLSESFAGLAMCGDTWDSLNADEQALIEAAGVIFMEKSYELAEAALDGFIATIEDSGLCTTYTLSAEEQAQFVDIAQNLYVEMEASMGEKGAQLVDVLAELNGEA